MKNKANATGAYALLIAFAAMSLTYYVAGVFALREEFFHAGRYAESPFEFQDDGQTLDSVRKEAQAAGLSKGDLVLSLNGATYTGFAQTHDFVQQAKPGTILRITTRTATGKVRESQIKLAPREGPDFTLGGYFAILLPVLGVPLLGLLIGFWVVAARPHDLNAWLALVLLTFPEILFGNLDWKFWPSPWYLLLGLWGLLLGSFVFPAFLWFGFLFPERWRADVRLPWFRYAILATSCCVFVLETGFNAAQWLSVQTIHSLARLQRWTDLMSSWLSLICVLLFLVALVDKLRSASTADARRRLRVLVLGSSLSLGPLVIIFGLLPVFGINPHQGWWFVALVPLISVFPLTLAYVLIVQRAMDVRILLRMGTKYLLARATVITLEVAAVAWLILRFVVPMMQRKEHQLLNFLLLVVCSGALFLIFLSRDSASQRLQRWIDRQFFRDAYDSEHLLSELSEQVRVLTDTHAVFEVILRRLADVLHVSQISILLRGGNVFHLQQALGMEFASPVVLAEGSVTIQNLQRSNQPATVYRDRPEPWYTEADADEKAVLRSIHAELLLPVSGRAHLIGLIALGPKKSEEPYTPTDLRTLQSVALQTGLTLEVADLAQKLADQAAHRERMNREIEIAREVQQRLFPQSMPRIPGASLAGYCRPASEVGGDYYDLMEMEDGRLGLAIGDVSGKGISAALIMASLRASLRGLLLDGVGDLAGMMEKVNRLVYEASSSSRYATFFFATFDPRTREFRYVNAGHNPPLWLQQQSGEVRRLEACGPVVGLLPFTAYEVQSLILAPGDLLVAYTDGMSEAMTTEDEEWGEGRMVASIPQHGDSSAEEVLNTIFRAADAFTAGAEQHDDMTLLVMKLV